MTKRRALALAGCLLIVLAGCSGASEPEASSTTKAGEAAPSTTADIPGPPPPCPEVFANGRTANEDLTDKSCTDTDGEELTMATLTLDCEDGRTLRWNQQGWGYDGEPWHRHASGEDEAPDNDQSVCAYG